MAYRLADEFDLEVVIPEKLLREALFFGGRPVPGTFQAELNVNKHIRSAKLDSSNVGAIAENTLGAQNAYSPYAERMKALGERAIALLDAGEVLDEQLYVDLVVTKLTVQG